MAYTARFPGSRLVEEARDRSGRFHRRRPPGWKESALTDPNIDGSARVTALVVVSLLVD